jgi:hypothetical protein
VEAFQVGSGFRTRLPIVRKKKVLKQQSFSIPERKRKKGGR